MHLYRLCAALFTLALSHAPTAIAMPPAYPADAKIIAEATAGKLKATKGKYFERTCNESVDFDAELDDLNGDGQPEVFTKIYGNCIGGNVNATFAYQKALTFNPESYPAWINLGLICYSIENYEVAINCYQEAIGISDQDADTFYSLGLAYMGAGDLKQTAAAFSDALKLNPDHESAQDAVRETMYFLPEKQG